MYSVQFVQSHGYCCFAIAATIAATDSDPSTGCSDCGSSCLGIKPPVQRRAPRCLTPHFRRHIHSTLDSSPTRSFFMPNPVDDSPKPPGAIALPPDASELQSNDVATRRSKFRRSAIGFLLICSILALAVFKYSQTVDSARDPRLQVSRPRSTHYNAHLLYRHTRRREARNTARNGPRVCP